MAESKKLSVVMAFTLIFSFLLTFIFIFFVDTILSLPLVCDLIFVFGFIFIQWFMAPRIIASSLKLQFISEADLPMVYDIVNLLSKKAGLRPPRIALIKNPSPNAFVFGRGKGSSTLVLHTGLITLLDEDELSTVIAHELGHISHNDCLIITLASLGPLTLKSISDSLFGSGEESLNGSLTGIPFAAFFYFAAIVFRFFHVLSNLFLLWLSRIREFYSDEFSVRLTRSPHALETALAKISYGLAISGGWKTDFRVFCIEDPYSARKDIYRILENKDQYDLNGDGILDEAELRLALQKKYDLDGDGRLSGHELQIALKKNARGIFFKLGSVFSTHPPTFERIARISELARNE